MIKLLKFWEIHFISYISSDLFLTSASCSNIGGGIIIGKRERERERERERM